MRIVVEIPCDDVPYEKLREVAESARVAFALPSVPWWYVEYPPVDTRTAAELCGITVAAFRRRAVPLGIRPASKIGSTHMWHYADVTQLKSTLPKSPEPAD